MPQVTSELRDGSEIAVTSDLNFEREKWEASQEADERDYKLRKRDQDFKEAEAKRSRLINPLVIAIVGGVLAAIANNYSTRTTSSNQQDIERNKLSQERQLSIQKSEEERIHDALKLANCEQVKERLTAINNVGLISDVNRKATVAQYLKTLTCTPSPPPQKPEPSPPFELSSDWLGGGHSQGELCQALRAQAVARYPNRTIIQLSSREESKKDWLGHVEYKYFCTFQPQ
jgi:type II secretory pathway pseudopilin PulG